MIFQHIPRWRSGGVRSEYLELRKAGGTAVPRRGRRNFQQKIICDEPVRRLRVCKIHSGRLDCQIDFRNIPRWRSGSAVAC